MKIQAASRLKQVQILGEGKGKIIDKKDTNHLDLSWLVLAAPVYHISPNIDDYVLVNTIITISDIPNRNGIAFPLRELVGFDEPPRNRLAYEGWRFAPCFEEHNNNDCTKAKGVVFDVSLRKVDGFGQGKLWKITGILGFDKTKDPELASKIATGEINTYSMGALADTFTCSYCGEECTDDHCCQHISSINAVNFNPVKDYEGNTHIAFLNAHGLSPIEVSAVADPAWAPAQSSNVILNKSDKPFEVKKVVEDSPSTTDIFKSLTFNY